MISQMHSPLQNSVDRNCLRRLRLESDGMGTIQPNAKRILTVLATGVSLTLAGYAQRTDAKLPNAPAPTTVHFRSSQAGPATSVLTASLRRSDNPDAATATSTTGDVSLYTVVDLALRNSRAVHMAEADRNRVHGAMLETRDVYIPNLSIGSGLGYSYGFPLGNPTLFNVTSTSLLFSFSQHDYIRSTRAALQAATLSLKNARQQVELDAALDYIELDKTLGQVAALDEAVADTDSMISTVEDRMHAGLESKVNVTRAQLTRAQIRLREIQMQDHADELRNHLAGLTGLDPATILPAASSIPQLPDLDFHSLQSEETKAPLVQAAFATADSKRFSAMGDKNQNYRPTVGMAFQYARFAPFNGYSLYYNHFTYDNIGIGIQAVWPLFDPLRRDKAMESKAEAVHAQRQAELTRIQNDEGNFALWHSLRELEAQEQVADLQQQLAQDTLASIVTQMNQGAPNGEPVTPQQADRYRIEERTSYVDMRDAEFNVVRVKLDLLSAVGGLEDWAKESAQPQSVSGTIGVAPSSH